MSGLMNNPAEETH